MMSWQTSMSQVAPAVHELRPAPDPVDVFAALCELPHCIFLDSAMSHPQLGRYSYVAADPFAWLQVDTGGTDPLGQLAAALSELNSVPIADLPAFQGGAAGLFAYELGGTLETLPAARCNDLPVPLLAFGFYDVVVAFDHLMGRAWIISQGWPPGSGARRQRRADQRLANLRRRLAAHRPGAAAIGFSSGASASSDVSASKFDQAAALGGPRFDVPGRPGLSSNFTAQGFCRAVERAVELIHAGEIFQVNLAQRLMYPASHAAPRLYLDLRRANPAPFAAYFDLGDCQIVSASPERFLRVEQGHVETRPIKGTRPRRHGDEADLFAGDDLRESEKDRAENVMIVDLMRNDLSRVCHPDSVAVTQLCQLEAYQYVLHLVSAVTGRLAEGQGAVELLRAAFPAGSISGAPKIRAMQIIAEMEPHARGAYCGSMGYVGSDGAMDLSVLIRTITMSQGWWQFPVGGGIVAQSDPQREYDETWHKAEGLLRAVSAR
jgi:para-aminobenzoate synthetase component 1